MIEIEVDDEVELKIGNAKKGRVCYHQQRRIHKRKEREDCLHSKKLEKGTYDIRNTLVEKPVSS